MVSEAAAQQIQLWSIERRQGGICRLDLNASTLLPENPHVRCGNENVFGVNTTVEVDLNRSGRVRVYGCLNASVSIAGHYNGRLRLLLFKRRIPQDCCGS